jgi:predicted transcriptional regulator
MDTPDKIRFAAERLREGHRVNRITVRDFLRHFGVERRGAVKVQEIRTVLESLSLATEPDFETAWIDGPIWLGLKNDGSGSPSVEKFCEDETLVPDEAEVVLDGTPSAVQQAVDQAEMAPVSSAPESTVDYRASEINSIEDPTFRIGRLPAANKKIVGVNQNDTLQKAVALLQLNDFSQLPVMHGEREVKGVITWKAIGTRLASGKDFSTVGYCHEEARVVDSNRTLFDVIPIIVEFGYVLVRDQRDRKITGIVTASDLSLEFQALSEPFLLLREIELHIRKLLDAKLDTADLDKIMTPQVTSRKAQNFADLSFGEYVRLIQHPGCWSRLGLTVDSGVLIGLLEEIRIIRNDVMHFDPDPMTAEELGKLKQAARFLQEVL